MVWQSSSRTCAFKACVAAAAAMLLSQAAQAAVVATYLPPPSVAQGTVAIVTAANVDGLIAASDITASGTVAVNGQYGTSFNSTAGPNGSDPGITTTPFFPNSIAPNGRTGTGTATSAANAIAANAYFTFSLQPSAGNQLQLSSLSFDVAAGSASDSRGYDLRSSADNYAASLATETIDAATYVEAQHVMKYVVVDLSSLPTIGDAAPVTFRFYIWNSNGNSGKNIDFDNIVVNGAASTVPEPASLALLGLGSLAMLRRRRH